MSVFTTVTREQLGAWLRNYDVGTLAGLEGIAAGIENTTYHVTTSSGRFILTLFEKLKAHELPFYLGLMDHLAQNGLPSARPVPDRSGSLFGELNGKPSALVSFLPGADITEPTPPQCAQAGALLAKIHLAGSTYSRKMDNPRSAKWWSAVQPEIMPFLGKDDAALLGDEIRYQDGQRNPALPRGAIHADYFRDNVLWENGAITGVIDFYFACTDTLLYDVAIAVNDWCLAPGGVLADARAGAQLDAYGKARPYSAAERAAWPAMLRAGALRFWVSRLYDFYLPRPGELTHAKDPAHFGRMLANHVRRERDLPRLPA